MAAFTYDAASGRYRAEGGRFVPDAQVRAAVDAVADASSERMAALAQRLRAGSMPLAEFQAGMMAEVRVAHLANGIAAYGGVDQLSQANYGFMGRLIRDEYARVRTFAADIAEGRQPLDGRLDNRAKMYGAQSRQTFSAVTARERALRGAQQERNVLGKGDSCDLCRAQSARGWVGMGALVPPGRRTCLSRCNCYLTYRAEPIEVAA